MVLARGLGMRMRQQDAGAALTREQHEAADAGLKPLMPINGHPFLAYVLDSIANAGVHDVALVVAPEHAAVRQYLIAAAPRRLTVSCVVQLEPRGTADAVLAVRDWVDGDPFLVMNADNLYPSAALRDLVALSEPGFPAFDADDLIATSNIPEERIRAFAFVDIDDAGYVRSIVEKPSLPPEGGSHKTQGAASRSSSLVASRFSRTISMNLWRFDAGIFQACTDVPRSTRGEFELPEAVSLAIARGMRIRAVRARGPVLDLSRRADAADVARRVAGITPCP